MTRIHRTPLTYCGVDLTHARLTELLKLADAAKPFYDWIARRCQEHCHNTDSFSNNLLRMSLAQITEFIRACYHADPSSGLPVLFDGKGRKYAHRKACFYFFGWLLRDAPVQRLSPIIDRASRDKTAPPRIEVEIGALARLFIAYRNTLGTFEWTAIREVFYDRLEGSRRASSGRQKEIVVRTAVAAAVQKSFEAQGSYGRFASIEIPERGIRIGTEEFDVVVNLLDAHGHIQERVLLPVKTRETEGGGHSHLFTRDIGSAIATARASGETYWIAAFIIAQNWSQREQEHVQAMCDFVATLRINPTAFESVDEMTQARLNAFFADVLSGTKTPKVQSSDDR